MERDDRPEVVLSCAWCDRPARRRVHPVYGLQYRCAHHYGCTCRPPGQAFHEPGCARRKGLAHIDGEVSHGTA